MKYDLEGNLLSEFLIVKNAAMMMYSMCNTSPRLMGKYTCEDFLSEKFLATGIINMIEEKKLNTDQIQEELLQYSVKHSSSDDAFNMGNYLLLLLSNNH